MKQTAHQMQAGFTLIEVLTSITIMSILLGFISVNLLHAHQATTVGAAVDRIVADMREQQIKALSGTASGGSGASYGVHVEPTTYTLFTGASYSPSTPTNYPIPFTDGITLTISPTSNLVFQQQSGEVTSAPYTITVTNADGSQQKTITVNRLGVITAVQ